MYTATVLLTIEKFIPMSGIYGQGQSIVATISPPTDTSPPPYPDDEVFSGDGESIQVTIPANYPGSVQLTFQLPDPRYVLLGVSFRGPNGGAGRMEFRTVTINRDPFCSQMTVTDACANKFDQVDFDYVILVQEVATANIGLIDPDIETEVNED